MDVTSRNTRLFYDVKRLKRAIQGVNDKVVSTDISTEECVFNTLTPLGVHKE